MKILPNHWTHAAAVRNEWKMGFIYIWGRQAANTWSESYVNLNFICKQQIRIHKIAFVQFHTDICFQLACWKAFCHILTCMYIVHVWASISNINYLCNASHFNLLKTFYLRDAFRMSQSYGTVLKYMWLLVNMWAR